MNREGPPLESLTHRLAETPEEFLAEPRIGSAGRVNVAAVVGDLIEMLGGGNVRAEDVSGFISNDPHRDRNRLSLVLILCWLLADDWFRHATFTSGEILQLLAETAAELVEQAASIKFIRDPDRREELARITLARLGCRPAGESVAQAQDRLTSISSVERARVMRASREAEQRARAIREALARKAAEESADKWTRE